MKKMNFEKYQAYPTVDLKNRTWPDKVITKAPIWCSVDLRDGNQALSIPMSVEEKLRMFQMLVDIGFKEIEVGFPSAADVEFSFVRRLIEENLIPDDVTIQVLTQAREHLIKKTFKAIEGAKNAIVHLYNSTSTVQRKVVFRKDKQEIIDIAVQGAKLIKELQEKSGNPGIRTEYSPESFTGTELDYALDVCHAVLDVWQPTPEKKVIINLPTTVEMSTPNIYADRIEWFCNHLKNRESVIISLHTHNDRGTGVASAELAMMAGADRVEGALFGNGERAGNMDIVTLALNLFSQGVDPELDFTDINAVAKIYKECTRMEIHPRHPYTGDLVYTAFSGSHQDAINKGMKAQKKNSVWEVPYLYIDPQDVGRTYESIIRVNSQSGKGGVAYVIETDFGIQIPKWMQPDFAKAVQFVTEKTGRELSPDEIHKVFEEIYLNGSKRFSLKRCSIDTRDFEDKDDQATQTVVNVILKDAEHEIVFEESGNGPVDAFVQGLKRNCSESFVLQNYSEHAIAQGSNSKAIAYIQIETTGGAQLFGAGIDPNTSIASMKAVLSALNRV